MVSQSESVRLVFIHGLGSSETAWSEVREDQQLERFETVAISLATPEEPGDVAKAYREQLLAAIAHSPATPTVIVGHSLGGLVAGHFAAACPLQKNVAGMVLVSSALVSLADVVTSPASRLSHPLVTLRAAGFFSAAAVPWPEPLLDSVLEHAASRALAFSAVDRSPCRYTAVTAHKVFSLPKKSSVSKVLQSGHALSPRTNYERLQYDTVFLTGANDRLTSKDDHEWCVSAAGASHSLVMPNLGHWPHLEDPHAFATLLVSAVDNLMS